MDKGDILDLSGVKSDGTADGRTDYGRIFERKLKSKLGGQADESVESREPIQVNSADSAPSATDSAIMDRREPTKAAREDQGGENEIEPISFRSNPAGLSEKPPRPAVSMPAKRLEFPGGFLWGTSTSAYQIEGGNVNDWSEWETSAKRIKALRKKGESPDNFICGKACDSYGRYEEDFDLAKKLNTNAVRFGLEWSRIEPQEGVWDVEAINHYRRVIEAAKRRNLKVVLTLWHWTNPTWIAKQGGWENKKTVDFFARYVDTIVKEYGTQVDYWVTLNEPMVPIGWGYFLGSAPPAKRFSLLKAFKAFLNFVEAHKKAYEVIHKHFTGAQVSATHLINDFEPARKWCPTEIFLANLARFFHQNHFLARIKNHVDFIGLDYYHHDLIVWYPPFKRNKNKRVSDVGWEIYPQGIYHVLKYLARYKKPILIMENGLADADDSRRPQFLLGHLENVYRAISEGVDVRGYFYWSLLDNFEWNKGWAPKFGLFRVDRDTFWRSPRPSVKLYTEICRNNAINIDSKD